MSELKSTKYPNNIRTVTGSVLVYPDDVVLLCDTSIGPVTINLLGIPLNYWSTQYKLYVIDKSGNASVNNITIVAGNGVDSNNLPVPQKINTAATQIINNNYGGCIVRIHENYTYIANNNAFAGASATGFYQTVQDEGVNLSQRAKLNFVGPGVTATDDAINNATIVTIPGGGSGFYQTIQDEGVALPQQIVLDFQGAGVTATNGAGKTIVTIPGAGSNFISLTNAALQALITGGTIQPGTFYQVTNPLNASSVVVQGIAGSSSSTLQGSGVFLNADYQKVGNYSGVAGFVANKGIWEPTPPPAPVVAGDVVIWFNLHYKNLTGVWYDGLNTPDTDAVNWVLLSKSKTNGYIEEVDFVKYNVTTNRVIYRADKRLNEVDDYTNGKGQNSIDLFQWGRDVVYYNKVLGQGLMICTNSNSGFYYNEVSYNGYMTNQTDRVEVGNFTGNIMTQNGQISIDFLHGVCAYNYISGASSTLKCGNVEINSGIGSNVITEGGAVDLGNWNGSSQFFQNTISQLSSIVISGNAFNSKINKIYMSNLSNLNFILPNINGVELLGCEISDNFIILDSTPRTYTNRKIRKDFSNWEETLDMNGGVFAAGVLTINVNLQHVGIFTLINSTGKVIDKIVNQPSNHKYIIKPDAGQSVGLQHTLIAGAVANNMVCDAPAPLNTITGRVNGCDFIEYQKSGNLCLRTNLVLLA